MKNIKFIIGNVAFTDEGVQVLRKYDEDRSIDLSKHVTYEDIRPWLVAFCQRRMKHCVTALESNIPQATKVLPEIITWKNGHFSVDVYKNMKNFVDSQGDKREFNAGILQQVLREMFCKLYIYKGDCDQYWYEKILKSEIYSADVYNVLTEVMLVNMQDINLGMF